MTVGFRFGQIWGRSEAVGRVADEYRRIGVDAQFFEDEFG